MSDVEKYWNTIAAKSNDPRRWSNLSPQEQQMVIQSINLMLMVLNNHRG